MDILSIWFLALALAMDCFAVSTTSGMILSRRVISQMLTMAFFFGFFQAIMPLIGWAGMSLFSEYIERFDHWIAFAMLLYLGQNMIRESFKEEDEKTFNPCKLSTILTMSVATSIDALAVGITFSCTGYDTVASLIHPLLAIGFMSFLMSIIGSELGARFGSYIQKRVRPELIGGTILILIGLRILVEHLFLN